MSASMTNKLLATVMAFALSGALTARASQDLHLAQPAVHASSLPAALKQVAATATTALDPTAGSIRQAYQQDHDALEHLRQQGSGLGSPAHQQFNQLIGADQAQLLALEKAALDKIAAGSAVNGTATIAQMAAIVAQAQASLNQFQSQASATKPNGNGAGKTNGNGQKP
ncbi:MAG TPA: hypothetical protein VET82_07855 [Candidatus Eisenbacteria bacterium]|nr:hypothetical protein [Candidatus Eisenbacteria bacterium]